MRLLHYIEIENFKTFGDKQRIELEHPAVIIGPNNCGKTSAIQAIALWAQAVGTWYGVRRESSATERAAAPLNRLNIVSVPVQRTRFFWHETKVRTGNRDVPLLITAGVSYQGKVVPLTMRFRCSAFAIRARTSSIAPPMTLFATIWTSSNTPPASTWNCCTPCQVWRPKSRSSSQLASEFCSVRGKRLRSFETSA
jgi:hypothetical protein